MTKAPVGLQRLFNLISVSQTLVLTIILSLPLFLSAQISNKRFRHISTEQGLSNTSVNCIFQDSRGFIWIGTRDGLNKYDGVKVTIYKNNPADKNSLSDNFIRCIYEDANHYLWIGTSYGLNCFNPKSNTFTSFKHQPANNQSLANDIVTAVNSDGAGNLLVATLGGGLDVFNLDQHRFKHLTHQPKNTASLVCDSVNTIYTPDNKTFYVGTREGLDVLASHTLTFKHYPAAGHLPVVAITQDKSHQLWIATETQGVMMFDEASHTTTSFKHEDKDANSLSGDIMLSLLCDHKGDVWAGTVNDGLNLYNSRNRSFYRYFPIPDNANSLSGITASALFEDNQGNLWIGTHRGGVNLYTAQEDKFKLYRQGVESNTLSYNDVKAFFEDSKGNIWIGTDGGGLNLFNPAKGTFTHYKNEPGNAHSLSSNAVQAIAEDGQGNLWVGTWGAGLNLFDRKTGTFTHFKNNPADPGSISSDFLQRMLLDSQGNFWVTTYSGGGIDLLDPNTHRFKRVLKDPAGVTSFSGKNVVSVGEDLNHTVWFGTDDGGLNAYNLQTQRFTHYFNDLNKKTDSRVIFTDSRGRVWIGMAGLYLFDRKANKFNLFTTKAGLGTDFIKGITEDDDHHLWVSTSNGLTRLDPQTRGCEQFNTFDGLQGPEFEANAYLKARNGEMYFGGTNGFNMFKPHEITKNTFIPPVYITDFQLFNNSVTPGTDSSLQSAIGFTKKINLSYKQNSIGFTFAALNYTNARNNQYRYKLDGFDKDWQRAGMERKASYTNLNPGRYTFRVRASNNDGVWNNDGASVIIVITPPFWDTWWFKLLVVLTIVFGAYGFYHYRISTVRRQKLLLEKEVNERTAELKEQSASLQQLNIELAGQKQQEHEAREEAEKANKAKSIFLATMSHEIRTPMNGVIGMASLLAETQLTTEQQDYTNTIIHSGESLLNVINDILDFSKIESGKMDIEHEDFDLRVAIEDVMDLFSQRAAHQGIDLIYHIDENVPLQIVGDSLRLKQVLINLINNALKFPPKGEVFVKVSLLDQGAPENLSIGFSIKDSGIGIPEEKLSRLFQAFSQVDSSTTRKYGGTGLGLVICVRLVELMGGSIKVESKYGEGSVFSFFIKTKVSNNPDVVVKRFDTTGFKNKRVLIIDDNATNLTILQIQLEHWDMKPVTATSGEAALKILSADKNFDLIITDMEMPEMDGVGLANAVKSIMPDMPVIMLSSIGDETKKKFPGLFSSILVKPVKLSNLCMSIQLVLKQETRVKTEEKPTSLYSPEFAAGHPLNILVAEDNAINQKLIERVLNKLGYSIDIVDNGLAALQKTETTFYDVVLMDIQMPEMDGLEATQNIRQRKTKQPYIVAMTANAMSEDRDICLAAGMDDYLTKPTRIEDLIAVLKRAKEVKDRQVV